MEPQELVKELETVLDGPKFVATHKVGFPGLIQPAIEETLSFGPTEPLGKLHEFLRQILVEGQAGKYFFNDVRCLEAAHTLATAVDEAMRRAISNVYQEDEQEDGSNTKLRRTLDSWVSHYNQAFPWPLSLKIKHTNHSWYQTECMPENSFDLLGTRFGTFWSLLTAWRDPLGTKRLRPLATRSRSFVFVPLISHRFGSGFATCYEPPRNGSSTAGVLCLELALEIGAVELRDIARPRPNSRGLWNLRTNSIN